MEEYLDSTEMTIPSSNAYKLLFDAVSMIPISNYAIGFLLLLCVVLYNFLEVHILQDLFSGFRGQSVNLTFNSSSELYDLVVSKCRILHGRYLVTPWLSSPHVQTAFLNFFGRPPTFNYSRQLFHAKDGGTLALDWLLSSDVCRDTFQNNNEMSKDDKTPLMVIIPGLMSDSISAYIKHLAYFTAKHGWNVVVANHRGLGGISITSDCFYNAGWTEDVREVINYLHSEYPKAPLFLVGTSIGANILVKYLGEDGENVPIAGAAAICSPWDLLIGDRFISRKLQQKFYDRALAIGLKEYAQLHQPFYSRLADWEGIQKSRSVRDFDQYATCHVGKYETVDTYYRKNSSTSYVTSVAVPLLCISAIDDPVCTSEAIPWDECRANKNIVLATTQHGGHLAFFEGLTASELWWVRAVNEFFDVLYCSDLMHVQKKKNVGQHSSSSSTVPSIDEDPFAKDGFIAATMCNNNNNEPSINQVEDELKGVDNIAIENSSKNEEIAARVQEEEEHPIKRCIKQLSRNKKTTMWLLAYVAVITSWPMLASALRFFNKKRSRNRTSM